MSGLHVFFKKKIKKVWHLLPVLALLYFFSPPAFSESTDTIFSQAIETLLASQQHPLLLQPDFSRQRQALSQLYALNANRPIWLGEGRSEKNLGDALAVLSDAYTDGLNPANYDAEPLRRYVQLALSLPQTAVRELASYDLAISIALLRFIDDLYAGQVDLSELGYPTQFGSKSAIDAAAVLMRHRQQETIAELPLAVAPRIQQYQRLKRALAGYRKMSVTGPRAFLLFDKPLSPGKRDPQLPELRLRLHELGELAEAEIASIGESETLYDEMTVAAVMRLQEEQGLIADGIIGTQTAEVLNQSPAEKVAKIELAMERLRWLPELPSGRFIIVNIPTFELWAFRSSEDQNPLNMKVVVGKAYDNQTPMLWDEMEYLEFNPFWNIPTSIMTKEILPKLLRNANFLAKENIELLTGSGSNSEALGNVAQNIRHGKIRGRQRPGKKNPLGKVKFIFPNNANVYLHDTPSRRAFYRDRRDLSHGCVRVEDAVRLAEFVLDDQEDWGLEAIEKAMAGPKNRRVTLRNPIPVIFFYTTAMVEQDNKARFFPDIYDQDTLLRNALNRKSSPGQKPLLFDKNIAPGGLTE